MLANQGMFCQPRNRVGLLLSLMFLFSLTGSQSTEVSLECEEHEFIRQARENLDKHEALCILEHISSSSSNPCTRALAFLELGEAYYTGGIGLARNRDKAKQYFELVAQQSFSKEARIRACLFLALLELQGTELNLLEEAFNQLKLISEQTDFPLIKHQAVYYLATLYLINENSTGLGNWNEQVVLFMRKTNENGDNSKKAEEYLSFLVQHPQVDQIVKEMGSYAYARLLEESKNYKRAGELYTLLAAAAGFSEIKADAAKRLEKIAGILRDQDDCLVRAELAIRNHSMAEAIALLLSAEEHCTDEGKRAQIRDKIARCYWQGGLRVARNVDEAKRYFEKNADQTVDKKLQMIGCYYLALIEITSHQPHSLDYALDQLHHLTCQNHHLAIKQNALTILALIYMRLFPFSLFLGGVRLVTSSALQNHLAVVTHNRDDLKKAREYLNIALTVEDNLSLRAVALHMLAILRTLKMAVSSLSL